ncbi:MAG TPA: response regulator [Thermoanaerobaculia bacterium]
MRPIVLKKAPASRTVRCQHCEASYAPKDAAVCDCLTEHRTLRCSHCLACSCTGRAPEIQKRFRKASAEELQRLSDERRRRPVLAEVTENLPRPLVVVADDNFDIRGVAKRILEGLGYGVIAVENGEEAWDAVQRFRPEIALLDGLMPKGDGRDISRRIKNDPSLKTRTVIMTSLYTSRAQREEAFRVFGVDGYLAKPVSAEILKATMDGLLRPSEPEPPELQRS